MTLQSVNISTKIDVSIGQYYFIQLRNLSESHPFTVLDFDKKQIKFGIKQHGKWTNNLSKVKIGDYLYLDGPYGNFTKNLQITNKKVVILAGGIGITPFKKFIEKYQESVYLLYSNKFEYEFVYDTFFAKMLGNRYMKFVTQSKNLQSYENKNLYHSRIDTTHIANNIVDYQYYEYAICGSKSFISGMLDMLKVLNINKDVIHIEEF